MAVTTDRQYRQVLSASLAYRQSGIQDLVFNSNPVSAVLRDKDMFKTYTGPEIRVTLQIDKMTGQWYTGYDKFDINVKELLNDAVFTPKNLVVPFSLTGTEILANQGRTRVHNLVRTYLDTAEQSMQDLWEISLHSDGTTDAGREMIGLGGALPIVGTTGIYGGIDRATNPIWQTATYDAATDFTAQGITGWDSTSARPIIERVTALHSKGRRKPDLWMADLDSYQALSASMVAHQRIVTAQGRAAKLGFDVLQVATPAGTVEVVCATGVDTVMPANTLYAIDSDSLSVYYHSARNMVPLFPGDGLNPINQDAVAQALVWNGELVLANPRYSARVEANPPA